MSPHSRSDGKHWDPAEIRQEREFGWFREHEAELIENARRRRIEAEEARRRIEAKGTAPAPSARLCPNCARAMAADRIEGVEVEKCPSCEGFFFDRGELETVLLRHDAHRRGFFRRLLGFDAD